MKSLKRPGKHYPLSANQRVVKTNYSYQLRWTNTTEHDQDDGDDVGDNDEENCDDDDENDDDDAKADDNGRAFPFPFFPVG